MQKQKEFLYVGYYIDVNNHIIVKIGTTNNIGRRTKEHTRNYRRAKQYRLPPGGIFQMLGYVKLSKYNTLRYEDRNRQKWKEEGIGEFIRNDRFLLREGIKQVTVKIRKEYSFVVA